jgi:hypothetical protein
MVLALLGILTGLSLATVFVGRLVIGALDGHLLRRFTPVNAAGSAIVGTMSIVVVFSWLTTAGWPAPRIVIAVLGLSIGLLLLCITRGTLDVLRPRPGSPRWLGLLGPLLLAATLSFLPLIGSGDFNVGNDTFTYCALSQWLQDRGITSVDALEPASMMGGLPRVYSGGLRLGASYLLAWLQAAVHSPLSVLVYPAASAWSFMLVMAALAICLRSLFRLPGAWISGGLLAFAALPHSGYWAHHNGFLSQPLGLAGLLFGIALASRTLQRREQTLSAALLIGLVTAFLLTVYVPVLPFFGAAAAYTTGFILYRARQQGRLWSALRFVAASLLSFALLGFCDLAALFRGLPTLASHPAGYHIALQGLTELAFSMGALALYAHAALVIERTPLLLSWWAAVVACGLALWGAVLGVPGRARSLLVVLGLFAASGAYFSAWARDPWTQLAGNTWSVFKLVQWVYPLLFLLQCAGLFALRRRARWVVPAVALLVGSLAWQHRLWMRAEVGNTIERIAESDHRRGSGIATSAGGASSFSQLTSMQETLRRLPAGTLYLAGRADDRIYWLGPYLGLLAYPRPLLSDWDGHHPGRHAEVGRPRLIIIACRPTETTAAVIQDLGWDCGVLSQDRPATVEVGGRRLLGDGGTLRIMLFAPADTKGDLVIDVTSPGPARPLTVLTEGRSLGEISTWPAGERRLSLPLRSGLTPVDLRAGGNDDAPMPTVGSARYEPQS